MTLVELLARNAAERRDSPALLSLDASPLSHGALHALVERTIATLHEAGLSAEDTVVLSLGYDATAIAATTAIASACRAAPRYPDLTTEELATTFEVLRPAAVVVDANGSQGARQLAHAHELPLIEMNRRPDEPTGSFDLTVVAGATTARSPRTSSVNDVAIVLETSGTTGRPKQVPLTHANLLAGARAMTDVLGIDAADRCVHLAPMFNIAGIVAPLLVPLWAGGSTLIAGPFEADRFLHAAAAGATWWNAGPTVQRALSRIASTDADRWQECGAMLRLTRCGSAPLSADAHAELEDVYNVPVVHAYGMTETAQQVTSGSPAPGGSPHGSAGRAVENEVRVVTDDGEVANPGTMGEIQVRGPSVFAGYAGDPHINDAAFVDGWFRTGDLGRVDDDGFFTVIGRREEIMNRGGTLVSAAEVDAAAAAHPDVDEASTFAMPHPTLGQEIGLAVVTSGPEPPDLHSFLAARLAPQKRPRIVEVVATIPRTPTGKPRRAVLAEEVAVIRRQRSSGPPAGVLEQRVAALWIDVTGRQPDGRDDHFFLSGGDSLEAITLLAAIETEFGFPLEVASFLETPTVAGLAAAVREGRENRSHAPQQFHILQAGTGAMPVILFSGLGGFGITVAPLAGRIAEEHHVIAVDAPGLRAGRHPRRFEQLAADHSRQLRPLIGDGPCVLVGYSLGALVALEIARQLDALGVPTAIVSVDGRPPGPRRIRRRGYVLLFAQDIARALRFRESEASRRRARVKLARRRARDLYCGGRFSGPIWVLVTNTREQRHGLDLGWAEYLDRSVKTRRIPGDHRTVPHEPDAVQAVGQAVAEAAALLSSTDQHAADQSRTLPTEQ